MVDDTAKATYETIDALNAEVEKLSVRRIQLQNDWKMWAEKRNSLNSELKELGEKIRTIKRERDTVNAQVKDLKTSRDQLRAEVTEKRTKLTEITTTAKQMRSQVRGSFKETKESFEKLEWRQQTSSLDPREENRILTQIKDLEMQLAKHTTLNEIQETVKGQRATLDSLRLNAQSIHEKVLRAAEVSAKSHEEMMQLVKRLKETKAKADEAHKMYIQTRGEAELLEQQIVQKIVEKKNLWKGAFGDEEAERMRKGKELTERLAESGSAKLSQGKRLSFEEFKALMEQEKI